jgi:hypothetical protein
MKTTGDKARIGILREISDWLKLLGLIVLASEGILVIAYNSTEKTDPARKYFFPLMIGLFASIVIGVFVDRFANRSATNPHLYNDGQQYALTTRWYFKSGITEEELYFGVQANRVVGTRTTIHPKRGRPNTTSPVGTMGRRFGSNIISRKATEAGCSSWMNSQMTNLAGWF